MFSQARGAQEAQRARADSLHEQARQRAELAERALEVAERDGGAIRASEAEALRALEQERAQAEVAELQARPANPFRVPLCAARTLSATGPSRVTRLLLQ